MASTRRLAFLIALALLRAPALAQLQCLEATPGFHVGGALITNSQLNTYSIASFDDGSGPAIFLSGGALASSGSTQANGLVKWNGTSWIDTGILTIPTRLDLVVYDDGNGAKLYFVGETALLSTWNGSGLTPLPDQPNDSPWGGRVVDLGTGPELYIWGGFTQVGAVPTPGGIARFDGSVWTAVPNGLDVRGPFAAFDDGAGPKLHGVSYAFESCKAHIVRLDSGVWSDIGKLDLTSTCTGVADLEAFDDGSGPALYVAGHFGSAGGVSSNNVARWNGTSWSSLAGGITTANSSVSVSGLELFDDGSGVKLYAAGAIDMPGTSRDGIVRWNGAAWEAVGAGLGTGSGAGVGAMCAFDDGSGARLIAAGTFQSSGSAAVYGVGRWDGVAWSGLGPNGQGMGGAVASLKYLDDGSGPALYAGGSFVAVGDISANHVARWNGSGWSALGAGTNGNVLDFDVFDDGSGLALYVGGTFTQAAGISTSGLARWNGSNWSAVGSPVLNSVVNDLLVRGSLLYAGCNSSSMRSWNGTTWTNVGGGVNGSVRAMAYYQGFIYVAGSFTQAGGSPGFAAGGIARYSETNHAYSSAGTAMPGGGIDLAVHDDGTGEALWVTYSGGVRRLLHGVWSEMPKPGFTSLQTVDLGVGRPALIACGFNNLMMWSGSSWISLTSDTCNGSNSTIAMVPGSSTCAPEMWVGGTFTNWGGQVSSRIARLNMCGEPGVAFCSGDGSLATPCPCVPPNTIPNPSGAPGHGCANSFDLSGARMCAIGTTNPDTVTLRVTGLTPIGFTQFFKGDAQVASGIAFADGVRCVEGTIFRFGGQNAVNGTAFYPNPLLGLTTPISNGGTPPGSGQVGYYQAIYRNATPNFCTVDTLNITNAVSITW